MGFENEINANSAFNYVGVEVEAELGKKHLIWPSQCKYAFSDVYPRGSAAVNMFSISNISEFGPRGRSPFLVGKQLYEPLMSVCMSVC